MNSPGDDGRTTPLRAETTLVTAGRDTKAQKGFVNPPVVHGSTVLYPTADDLHAHRGEFQYGRHGTPTTKALQQALMALEGPQCAGVGLAPSGLSAITTTLLAVLKSGDHLLVCDNVYRPYAQFLQRPACPLRRRDHLFRSHGRRRHRRIVQAQHQGGARRGARFAILRNARHSSHRFGGACARRACDRRQHMGDPAVSPLARSGRRYQHTGRHQIYRWTFRHHVRNHFGERESLADDRRGDPAARCLRRAR